MSSVSVPCTCTITKNKNNANKPTITCFCRIGSTNVARVPSTISAIIPSTPTSTTASTNVPIYVPSIRSNTNVLNSIKKQVATAKTAAAAKTALSSYNNAPSSQIQKVLKEPSVEYKEWSASTQTRIDNIASTIAVINEDVKKINNNEEKEKVRLLYNVFLEANKVVDAKLKNVSDKIDSNTGEVDKALTTAETALKTLMDAVNAITIKTTPISAAVPTSFSIPGNSETTPVAGISKLGSLFENTSANTGSNEDPFTTKRRKQAPPITKFTSTIIDPRRAAALPPPPPSSSSSAGAPKRSINPDNKSGPSLLSQIQGVKLKNTGMWTALGITKGGRRTRRGRRAKRSHRRTRRMLGIAK
jgi:hypothetical protein